MTPLSDVSDDIDSVDYPILRPADLATPFTDGTQITTTDFEKAIAHFAEVESARGERIRTLPVEGGGYGYLLPKLQENDDNLLRRSRKTFKDLIRLGEVLVDREPASPAFDSQIPSAYTYFGQFVDHDLTRQGVLPDARTDEPYLLSWIDELLNARSAQLDLDCVYGPPVESTPYDVPRKGSTLVIEMADHGPAETDVPREADSPHNSLIGDRRNDENLIVSQMHVAFLRAHNAFVRMGYSFQEARQQLRRHYQYMVINDYLRRIADPNIVNSILNDSRTLGVSDDDAVMPLEFSAGAYRFGHSMIRNSYSYNELLPNVPLFNLFLPGFLVDYHHIPTGWIIDWTRFFDGRNLARRIRPALSSDLTNLDPKLPCGLATVDLLKGYLVRLPHGQAVARALNCEVLGTEDLRAILNEEQRRVFDTTEFGERTPLWFYVLCEATATTDGRLGPVGSTIVASALIAIARRSKDSYLRYKDWVPEIGKRRDFDLLDLFVFAGVHPPLN